MTEMLDKFKLDNKVAIVTGASKGIGEAMAQALGQAGAKVVVSSRKQDAVDEVVERFRSERIDATAIAANMGNMEEVKHLADKTKEIYGGVDIIINNAAANPVFGPMNDTEEWAFDKIMDVNVKGPFELAKQVHSSMAERGGGSIINISSVGGISPEFMLGIYSVSKAAIISLTKTQAREGGAVNIRANAICPGLIKTKFSQALWQSEEIVNEWLKQVPIQRMGMPEDVAGLALFLASDASAYCTGGVYTVDGGYTI